MNIIEAIKSGEPFRRRGWPHWWSCSGNTFLIKDGIDCYIGPEDMIADDWEIEEKRVQVSFTDIYNAFEVTGLNGYRFMGMDLFRRFCRELGLED